MSEDRDTVLLPVEEAERALREHVRPFPDSTVPLADSTGRVLREDLVADRDLPPFDRVTMDGLAISFDAWSGGCRTFDVTQVQPAGATALGRRAPHEGIKVMTGAVLPTGTDCVIPREYVTFSETAATVEEDAPVDVMKFVHPRGVDARRGDVLVPRSTAIGAPETLIAAAVGKTTLLVAGTPSVAVVSNGDELVPASEVPLPHQVRASNEHALCAALREQGIRDIEPIHYPDDRQIMLEGVRDLLDRFEILVLSGGISVGDYDYLPDVLRTLEVRPAFHRVRQRPGKPFWFGLSKEDKPVFALPGNPVSTLVCFLRYVRPWLQACMTGSWPKPATAVLDGTVEFKPPLTRFLQVRVHSGNDGRLLATPVEQHGSGDYASLAGTDGFIELDSAVTDFPSGYVAPFYPWR